jgi:hypothetical protein
MLELIDSVDWYRLHGAYGTVPELPEHVRRLNSPDPVVAEASLRWLGNNLIHQDTHFEVTPIAIPLLIDALAQSPPCNKEQLILLLLYFGVRGSVPPIPYGFYPDNEFADVKSVVIDPSDLQAIWQTDDWETLDKRLADIVNVMPRHDHYNTYLAMERGALVFARLTTDPEIAIRRAALWALGWFPNAAGTVFGQLRVDVARETDEYMLANELIVLGLSAKYLSDCTAVSTIDSCLSGGSRIVRRAAALALVTILGTAISTATLDVLIEATEDDENLARDTAELGWPWSAPSLKGVYWRAIHSLGL